MLCIRFRHGICVGEAYVSVLLVIEGEVSHEADEHVPRTGKLESAQESRRQRGQGMGVSTVVRIEIQPVRRRGRWWTVSWRGRGNAPPTGLWVKIT